jgi:lysophospholipase L1-like esterase
MNMKRIVMAAFALLFFAVLSDAEASGRKKKDFNVEHPWAGAKVAYLGDSITDAGVLKEDTHYWGFLQQWLDIEPLVYGRSGHQWHQIAGQADKLMAEHGDDFDAIMIFVGTNDYNAGVPIGEWFTEEKVTVNADGHQVERIRRAPVMDQKTYRGRINSVLDKLKRMYPTKQIVLLTPIHRAYAKFADHNVQPDESHQNACGEYVDAYVASIKEASAIWSVPVIDTYALSGLFPMHQEQQMYFPGGNDWLHPDQDGHRRFALCLYYQLLTLPCRF